MCMLYIHLKNKIVIDYDKHTKTAKRVKMRGAIVMLNP